MANPNNLHSSFTPRNSSGACGICAQPFMAGGEEAFYGAFLCGSSGTPLFTSVAQLETKGPEKARTQQRPSGCTCTNSMLHSKGTRRYRGRAAKPSCGLYRACDCGTRNSRRHGRNCAQRIQWATSDGVWAGMVHVACVAQSGCAVPSGSVVPLPGTRTVAYENTAASGSTPDTYTEAMATFDWATAPPTCGKTLLYSSNTCVLASAHNGACIGNATDNSRVTSTPEQALATLSGTPLISSISYTPEPSTEAARIPDLSDNTPLPESESDEVDPSIARFLLLDLD